MRFFFNEVAIGNRASFQLISLRIEEYVGLDFSPERSLLKTRVVLQTRDENY